MFNIWEFLASLDPDIVNTVKLYLFCFFLLGLCVGFSFATFLFSREKKIFKKEKELHSEKLAKFEDIERELAIKDEELRELQEQVSKNELYWKVHKYENSEPRGNKALYEIIHNKVQNSED